MNDATPTEQTLLNTAWIDRFKAEHPLGELPEEARGIFLDLLTNNQGVRDYYQAIPEEKFDSGIGKDGLGDSPKKQLLHEIGNTRLRAESLRTGILKDWRYHEIHKDDYEKLQTMNQPELIKQLDASIADLYDAAKDPANLEKTISLPYGKEQKGLNSIWAVTEHKILHLGIMIASSDCIGGIPRPQSVKTNWG